MIKSILFYTSSLLLLTSIPLNAQQNEAVGYLYDYTGRPLDGYFGTDYEAQTDLSLVEYKTMIFVQGTYYNQLNEPIAGEIKFNPDNSYFHFREHADAKTRKINADECMGLSMQKDSFLVINNFEIDGNILSQTIQTPRFVQLIDAFNDRTYYKYVNSFNNTLKSYFLYKDNNQNDFNSFSKNKKRFKEDAIKAFPTYPSLIQAIKEEKYIEEDVLQLIKIYKYQLAYSNDNKIYLDNKLNEVLDDKHASYYSKIDGIYKNDYVLSYFTLAGKKLNAARYSAIFPFERIGINTWYHSNGNKRKEINYKDNEPEIVKVYNLNGERTFTYSFDYQGTPYFEEVYNENKENILDLNGSGKVSFYDHILNRELTNIYSKHILISSSYVNEHNHKVYLRAERNSKLKSVRSLNVKLKQTFKYPTESISNGHEGVVLVKCLIDEKGITKSTTVIKSVDQKVDIEVLSLFQFFKTYKHWKPAKVNNQKVMSEVIIPVQIKMLSHNPYNNYYNMFWMHDMYMHQQMQFTPPTPPQIPSFN